jgi:hypothetical protein
VILAISSDTEAPCFDSRETETNSFAESSGIDMRNPVLVTDPTVGKIKPLTRNITVRIRGIIAGKPEERTRDERRAEKEGRLTHQACTKICFALSDALVVVAARTFAASFSRV